MQTFRLIAFMFKLQNTIRQPQKIGGGLGCEFAFLVHIPMI